MRGRVIDRTVVEWNYKNDDQQTRQQSFKIGDRWNECRARPGMEVSGMDGGGGKTSGKYVFMIMVVVVKTARVLVIQEEAKWQTFRTQTS